MLKSFGLYEKTGVDFPDEIKPYTISYKKWDKLRKVIWHLDRGSCYLYKY